MNSSDNFHKYNPSLAYVTRDSPQYSFSNTSMNYTKKTPESKLGPGYYDIKKQVGESYKFSKQGRWKTVEEKKNEKGLGGTLY